MATVLVILSVFCITAYTAVVCTKFKGIPSSISATFYKLDHKLWFGASDPGLLPVHGFLSMCRNVYGWRSS